MHINFPRIVLIAIVSFIAITSSFFSITSTSNAQTDSCSDILREGVFNQFQSLNSANYASRVKSAICASGDSVHSGSSAGGVSIGVPLPLDGGGVMPLKLASNQESQRFRQIKQSVCGGSSSEINQEDLNWITKRVASDAIVNAWLGCMERTATAGLQVNIDGINGNNFFVKVRWGAALSVNQATVEDFFVIGAKCDPLLLRPGRAIRTEVISQPCTRDGDEGVSIAINTDAGSATAILPERRVEVIRTDRELCLGGDTAACQRHSATVEASCGAQPTQPPGGPPSEAVRNWFNCRARANCWRFRVERKRDVDARCAQEGRDSFACVFAERQIDCDNVTAGVF